MNKILSYSLIIISLLSCSESDDDLYLDSNCDHITIVDNDLYKNIQFDDYLIRSVQLTGDCLEVEIESGGCSGNTWKVDLIDAGRVLESHPEQRDLKISLDNQEICNLIIIKTYTFDLRPIQTRKNVILLNLEGWDDQIRYEY
jgi:hypothetical protein